MIDENGLLFYFDHFQSVYTLINIETTAFVPCNNIICDSTIVLILDLISILFETKISDELLANPQNNA
jgi:hypothetical protein